MNGGLCRECGKPIPESRRNAVFCSDACREEAAKRRKREAYRSGKTAITTGAMEKTCLYCGTVFRTDSRKQLYCCTKCTVRAARARARERNPSEKRENPYGTAVCEECGAVFVRQNSTHKYCCRKCTERARIRKVSEERRAAREIREAPENRGAARLPSGKSLREIAKEATDRGMSYGAYVAAMTMR